jgi:inosine-uridine nucleoside N-ribohydrolase
LIDDAMAIFLALRSPEVEVIGLTTIYGNVYTTLATRNALHLVILFVLMDFLFLFLFSIDEIEF